MPETRLRKARASLPVGYQFGDSATSAPVLWWPEWRTPNSVVVHQHAYGEPCSEKCLSQTIAK